MCVPLYKISNKKEITTSTFINYPDYIFNRKTPRISKDDLNMNFDEATFFSDRNTESLSLRMKFPLSVKWNHSATDVLAHFKYFLSFLPQKTIFIQLIKQSTIPFRKIKPSALTWSSFHHNAEMDGLVLSSFTKISFQVFVSKLNWSVL